MGYKFIFENFAAPDVYFLEITFIIRVQLLKNKKGKD